MSLFHFCLSAAKNLSSFQLLPASFITDLLQLFFGLPLFLFPWGFQCRAAFGISPSSFLNAWPIHLNFLFLISKFTMGWPPSKWLSQMTFYQHKLKTTFVPMQSPKQYSMSLQYVFSCCMEEGMSRYWNNWVFPSWDENIFHLNQNNTAML